MDPGVAAPEKSCFTRTEPWVHRTCGLVPRRQTLCLALARTGRRMWLLIAHAVRRKSANFKQAIGAVTAPLKLRRTSTKTIWPGWLARAIFVFWDKPCAFTMEEIGGQDCPPGIMLSVAESVLSPALHP